MQAKWIKFYLIDIDVNYNSYLLWSHPSIYCRIVKYTNPAQLTAQKTTPQTFQSFQATTINEA